MKINKLSLAISLLCLSSASSAQVLISEVLYDAPNSDSTEEFVELYNTSCDAVDLGNYSINDNSSTYNLSGTLAGGSYFTIARNASGFSNLFGQSADMTSMTLALGNSGDWVSLKQNGTEVDLVAWENKISGWNIYATNVSIARNSTTDTDSVSDWTVQSNAGAPKTGVFSGCDGGSGGGGGGGTEPPANDELTNGVAKTGLSASTGEQLNYFIDVPDAASNLAITTSGGSGDVDLYTKFGSAPTTSSYDCRPYASGNSETCTVAAPQTGSYHVMLNAYSAFSSLSLVASYDEDTGGGGGGGEPPAEDELTNGVAKTNLSAATNEELNYFIDVPADATNLNIAISGGSGDADLHTKQGSAPTTSSYDCRPYASGNNESCTVASPVTGKYYAMVRAYQGFSSLTLTASFSENSGGGGGGTPPPGSDDPAGYSFNGYYANAIGQTGSNLKSALNGIIKNGHTKLSYTPGVWDALGFTDEDPNNSNNVLLIYKGTSIDKATRAGQSNSQDAWNREHVWPKSHGFPSSGQWAYTDIHHLRPSDVSINSSRGNKDFDNGGTPISEAPENKTDSDSFEPRDEVKGDAARMVFYMATRYEGNDSSGTPDLEIVDYVNTGSNPLLGKLCTLVQWHRNDAVSAQEVRRNGRIHQRQGNRNPFIDNPDWVEDIYGSSCP